MPEDTGPANLTLLARDIEDLSVVSAAVQDALVTVQDVAFLKAERAFVMALTRFRWEQPREAAEKAGERVHAALRFDRVARASFRDLDRENRDRFLSLLSVAYDDGVVAIHFSGGGVIRLEVDDLLCSLRDLDEPWPTLWRPEHREP